MRSLLVTLWVLATAAPNCIAFLSPLADGLKRASLKKELIQAATAKDEARVISLVEKLALVNPTEFPTAGLKGYGDISSTAAPLNGEWKLLFTNPKDAEAPARTEKNNEDSSIVSDGDNKKIAEGVQIKTGQRIDADKGECLNFIMAEGDNRPFEKLEITIQMTPLSKTRVRLDFKNGRALNERAPLPFLKDFQFNFPPALVGDGLARLKGKDPNVEPPAYFDVLYIDQQLRAHQTGEGKIFVQTRGP
mmetsp:Transcript_28128/g.43122  ORF Transcript_28128/g.43122 Transcript_28128/m.43122 type:complete len:248 (-) Transcript_28128:176-919(-)